MFKKWKGGYIMRFKRLLVGLLATNMALAIAACGKSSKNDDLKSDLNEISSVSETQAEILEEVKDNNDTASSEEVTEETSGDKYVNTVEGTGYKVNINAEVEPIKTSNLSTYTINKKEYTDEEIVEVAKKLFDNGEYTVIKPFEVSSIDDLNNAKKYFQDICQEYNIEDLNVKITGGDFSLDQAYLQQLDIYPIRILANIDMYIDEFTGEYVSDAEGPVYELNDALTTCYYTPDIFTKKYLGGKKAIFVGKVDNKPWILLYQKLDRYRRAESAFVISDDPEPIPMDFSEFVAFDLTNNSIAGYNTIVGKIPYTDYKVTEENECSVEVATGVNDFLDTFGMDNYDVIETRDLLKIDAEGTGKNNGYGIAFGPRIEGCDPVVWRKYRASAGVSCTFWGYASCGLEGIDYIRVKDRYTWDVLEENPKVMDFEEANEYALKHLGNANQKDYIYACFMDAQEYIKEPTIYSIKLKNVVYSKEDGSAVCVPAWTYYWKVDNKTPDNTIAFAVDATDGTIISPYPEDAMPISYGYSESDMAFDGIGALED